jgi:hypothetical protein
MLHSNNSASLSINVRSASNLTSVQKLGKQDPYLQFSLDCENKDSFQKTFSVQNGGENATWNQSFSVPLHGESDLFVEVLDQESTVDEVIGFCAIPIAEIVNAPGANLNGLFDIYDIKGNCTGQVNLQFATLGFANSEIADPEAEAVRGNSYINDNHAARIKHLNNKVLAANVAGGALGIGAALAGGFFAKQMYDEHEATKLAEEGEQTE